METDMTIIRLAALAAMFAIPFAAPGYSLARSGLGATFPVACGAGYHTDVGGNCQPNGGESNRYCPRGTVFHTTFDGSRCDPPPREAY
jgi:hypothetical protein